MTLLSDRAIAVGFLAALTGCSGAGSPDVLTDVPLPMGLTELRATLPFGDAPVEGEFRIRATGAEDWSYSVDLDADGRPDEEGTLHLGITLPYRFEAPGVHRISATIENGGERYRFDRLVIVNDPAAVQLLAEVELGDVGARRNAIVLDEARSRLLVTNTASRTLVSLRPGDLTTIWQLDLPFETNDSGQITRTEDIELSGDVLYVDTGDSLVAIDVGAVPSVGDAVAGAHWGRQIEPRPDGALYIGGAFGLAIVEPATGVVRESMEPSDGFGEHFAVSPDGRTIAFLVVTAAGEFLLFLDADDLVELRRVEIEQPLGIGSVSFHPDGSRIYVFSTRGSRYQLDVIETASGRLAETVDLGPAREAYLSSLAPVARSSDGRFLVIPTVDGTFFLDTTIDLPRYRGIEEGFDAFPDCCSVAASTLEPVFYVTDGSVVKTIRLAP